MKTSIIVDLAGNLSRRARQYQRSIADFSKSGQQHLGKLKRSAHLAGKGLDKLGNRYTAILGGAAGFGAAKSVVELDARLKQLQTDGRMSADQIALLKKELFDVANDKNIRLNPDRLLEGFEEIITRTGASDFAIENLRNLALTIRATNAAGGDVGAVFSNLYKGGVREAEELLAVTDALIEQTKTGSVAFRDVAKVGNKLFAPYIAAGRDGGQAFKDMGAVAQIAIDAVGSPDEATEATKGLLANLKDPKIQKILASKGIKVFDGKQIRSLPGLLVEIYNAADRNISRLSTVFGETGIKVFEGLSLEGNLEKMEQLAKLQADGGKVINSAAENAGTAKAALTSLATTFETMANDKLSGPIQSIADSINSTDQSTKDMVFKGVTGAVLAGGAAIIARKLFKTGQSAIGGLRYIMGGKKGAAGKSGGLLGAGGGLVPTPVFVVNMPGGGIPGLGGKAAAGGAAAGGLAKAGRLASLGKSAGLVGLAGAAGYGAGTLINIGWNAILSKVAGREMTIGTGLYELFNQQEEQRMKREFGPNQSPKKQEVGGRLEIEIKGAPAKVTRLEKKGDMDIDVDAGVVMSSP